MSLTFDQCIAVIITAGVAAIFGIAAFGVTWWQRDKAEEREAEAEFAALAGPPVARARHAAKPPALTHTSPARGRYLPGAQPQPAVASDTRPHTQPVRAWQEPPPGPGPAVTETSQVAAGRTSLPDAVADALAAGWAAVATLARPPDIPEPGTTYTPLRPFTDWLSDDTLARGFGAVK